MVIHSHKIYRQLSVKPLLDSFHENFPPIIQAWFKFVYVSFLYLRSVFLKKCLAFFKHTFSGSYCSYSCIYKAPLPVSFGVITIVQHRVQEIHGYRTFHYLFLEELFHVLTVRLWKKKRYIRDCPRTKIQRSKRWPLCQANRKQWRFNGNSINNTIVDCSSLDEVCGHRNRPSQDVEQLAIWHFSRKMIKKSIRCKTSLYRGGGNRAIFRWLFLIHLTTRLNEA